MEQQPLSVARASDTGGSQNGSTEPCLQIPLNRLATARHVMTLLCIKVMVPLAVAYGLRLDTETGSSLSTGR